MRPYLVIAAIIVVGALFWVGMKQSPQERDTSTAQINQSPEDPPTSIHADGVDIFQKAFWKRPGTEDTILHAERREWADADGVRKWQWFLAIEPSPALVKHLRESNHLSLSPASSAVIPSEAPAWFSLRPAEMDILQRPGGSMQLCFNKTGTLLYATESGVGFTKGAEAPITTPVAQARNPGRLPTTPPPTPERP
jgi:hypothetical protein